MAIGAFGPGSRSPCRLRVRRRCCWRNAIRVVRCVPSTGRAYNKVDVDGFRTQTHHRPVSQREGGPLLLLSMNIGDVRSLITQPDVDLHRS